MVVVVVVAVVVVVVVVVVVIVVVIIIVVLIVVVTRDKTCSLNDYIVDRVVTMEKTCTPCTPYRPQEIVSDHGLHGSSARRQTHHSDQIVTRRQASNLLKADMHRERRQASNLAEGMSWERGRLPRKHRQSDAVWTQ